MKEVKFVQPMTDELRKKFELFLHEIGLSSEGELCLIHMAQDSYTEDEQNRAILQVKWREN